VLAPLELGDVGRSSPTRSIASRSACGIGGAVQEKTGGNPFSRSSSLSRLADEAARIRPSRVSLAMEHRSARAKSYTDNVVDLMVEKLKRCLPPPRKPEAVGLFGQCRPDRHPGPGSRTTEEAMHTALWEAVIAGLVVHQGSATNSSYGYSRQFIH